jgi:hypothetical protein
VGTSGALVISMLIEYALKVEGLSQGRLALKDAAAGQLLLAAPLIAIAVGFFASRRYAPASQRRGQRRAWTLRQLFIGQLIAGLLLGWWAYTRRDEIHERRNELEWRVRNERVKALFEPIGWYVYSWPGVDEITLGASGPPRWPAARDEQLPLAVAQGPVSELYLASNEITDQGLPLLSGAARLRQLQISSNLVTDEGIAALAALPRLRYLRLGCPQLTGECLQSLAKVRSLRYVEITTVRVTPQDAETFRAARPDVNLRIVAPAQ